MSDQMYEQGYKNLGEGGYFYRNQWYPTEQSLNSDGYFEVENSTLYIGPSKVTLKYQSIFYLLESTYYTYSEIHKLGYSLVKSSYRHFINTSDGSYLEGYYNDSDGYFVLDSSGVWYPTLESLNTAGYEVVT